MQLERVYKKIPNSFYYLVVINFVLFFKFGQILLIPITIISIILALINPINFFSYLALSQIITQELVFSLSLTQILILSFFLSSSILGFKKFNQRLLPIVFFAIFICFISTIFTSINGTLALNVNLIVGVLVFLISILTIKPYFISISLYIKAISICCLLPVIVFYFDLFGFEMVRNFVEATSVRNLTRTGFGNLDSNSFALNVVVGYTGFLGTFLFKNSRHGNHIILTNLFNFSIFLLILFPIITTGSRSGLIFYLLITIIIYTYFIYTKKQLKNYSKTIGIIKVLKFYIVSFLILFLSYFIFSVEILDYYEILVKLSEMEFENETSRAHISSYFYSIFVDNFFMGVPNGFRLEIPGSNRSYLFGEFQAHNNFLEILTIFGLPVGLCIFYLIYFPNLYLLKRKLMFKNEALIFIMFVLIMFSMTFTIYSWKLLWVFSAISWVVIKTHVSQVNKF